MDKVLLCHSVCHVYCVLYVRMRCSFHGFFSQVINDYLTASEKRRLVQWEEFVSGQPQRRAEVDEEHRRAVERLREQYAAMEKDLAKFSTF